MLKRCITFSLLLLVTCHAFSQVHTTYHWHLQQPIYWPEVSELNNLTCEKAWESIQHINGGYPHPQNDVEQIFTIADRQAAYQWRVRDAIAGMSGNDAGAQISYMGCLAENVSSLGSHSSYGYSPSWNSANQQARGWTTSGGQPRLDIVIVPYHHALAPLIDENALRKEIQLYQAAYADLWGSTPTASSGFFPPELAFSPRIIQVLVEEGIDWVFVPNNHLSRACENFPLVLGTGGENCDPPNRADQLNPASGSWFSLYIDRGCTPTNAVPFAYTPHRARHIDPDTGIPYDITVVPVAQAMSWEDGYQMYGVNDINQIAWASDPVHPMLISLAHDGDNAWGGGYSYYMESVPNFTTQALAQGYAPTVVEHYLAQFPVDPTDLIHIEDGAWVNADGDFGHPAYINWNWPLVGPGGDFDIPGGWAEDERNWAVITAAQNRVDTAEQLAGYIDINHILDPTTGGASQAELAWHFFLPALTSGYMYYGNSLDMEVKPTIACNNAVYHADQVIGDGSGDQTPPTIWLPQQLPHNPGATGYGPLWGYQQVQHDRDFYIWTFVYDVSGVATVNLRYRLDLDGENPLDNHDNEVYADGPGVTSWRTLPLQLRSFPTGNVYNDPDIDFFELPQYIADEYWIHVTAPELVETGNVLIDYYVEAMDNQGLIKRSPLRHTWIGDGSGSGDGGDAVSWYPLEPEAGGELTIGYDPVAGSLPDDTSPVYIHIGHSGWQNVISPDPVMAFNPDSARWEYLYAIPGWATAVDFVFNDGGGNWDNNNGQDWHVAVTGGGNPGYEMDGQLDGTAQLLTSAGGRDLWADHNDELLYLACTPAAAAGTDHLLFLAAETGMMSSAPWAKTGQVMSWRAFLGNEESNGWCGWFDTEPGVFSQSACGTVLEGVIDVAAEWGQLPENVRIALGAWETTDGGSLVAQLPIGNGDGNLDPVEFLLYHLTGPTPAAVTGLQLQVLSNGSVLLSWLPVTQSTGGEPLIPDWYAVHVSAGPFFTPDEGTLQATTAGTSWLHTGGVEQGGQLFYRVTACMAE